MSKTAKSKINHNIYDKTKENRFLYVLLFSLFIITFAYFKLFGNYLLYFQEQQSLFIFSYEYLADFLKKPGGVLELSGKFLTQFYYNLFSGAFLVALVITGFGILISRVNQLFKIRKPLSILTILIPSLVLLVMQTHYYHFMEYNLGFLLVLGFFLFSVYLRGKNSGIFSIILFPAIYYISGAFSLIFLGLYVIYILFFEHGKYKILYFTSALIISLATFLVFREFVFLQPIQELISYPLPFINSTEHKTGFYLLTGFIILYPVIVKINYLIKSNFIRSGLISLFSITLIYGLTILLLTRMYNTQTATVVKIEKMAFEENWDEIIQLNEKTPSKNLIGQYFYNVALSETNHLCDRLFDVNQDFGANSLILAWGNEHLNWGAYFYYSVGLINEAQRWAYEGMVVYGMRPQNLKMLIKTNLINGNYQMAEKYIGVLKNTLYYRDWANDYEKLTENHSLISEFPDLESKRKILPKKDFFIQINSPQNNIPLLLDSNNSNKNAFEYEMAWMMLTKDVDGIVKNLYRLKELGYYTIPRHLEEAALIYFNSKGNLPELGGLTISSGTLSNFEQYVSAYKSYRQNLSAAKEKMKKKFGNTFMYYFHFK